MNDDFVQAFMDCAISPTQFRHRDHLRLTWLLVRRLGPERAGVAISSGIRQFAAFHGQAGKYHETLTQFWVRLVAHMVAARPEIGEFEAFMEAFPQLFDKSLPYRHWRRETMDSTAARAAWVDPDLLALPR